MAVSTRRGNHELLGAEAVRVADGPAQDAAQHVAAALVGREDAVAHEHRAGAGVLGQDAQAEIVGGVVGGGVAAARGPGRGVDEGAHDVGVPHRVDALEQAQDALEAGAGVDARLGQRLAGAVGALVELHEHEVPELQEPRLGVGVERAAVGPEGGALVVVDLRARAAGPVSPICQKLSLSPRRWIRSFGSPDTSSQISSASSSDRWTVTHSFSGSKPSTLVVKSHAHGMASALK